jgi:hypothetical protein
MFVGGYLSDATLSEFLLHNLNVLHCCRRGFSLCALTGGSFHDLHHTLLDQSLYLISLHSEIYKQLILRDEEFLSAKFCLTVFHPDPIVMEVLAYRL